MPTARMKEFLSEGIRQDGLWVVAFVGICIMVALGKLKPETIEYMLFAMLGKRAAALPKNPYSGDKP